jgi:hypothetical protein
MRGRALIDPAAGCMRREQRSDGDVCVVITRKPQGPHDEELHAVLGHELRHCFEGAFHE